jgi:hypothetical protein
MWNVPRLLVVGALMVCLLGCAAQRAQRDQMACLQYGFQPNLELTRFGGHLST